MGMNVEFRQKVLHHLAALATEQGGASDHLGAELAGIPLSVIEELLEDLEELGWAPEDRARLLRLLARTSRRAGARRSQRARAGLRAASPLGGAVLAELAGQAYGHSTLTVAESLAQYLRASDGLTRAEVVLRWATAKLGLLPPRPRAGAVLGVLRALRRTGAGTPRAGWVAGGARHGAAGFVPALRGEPGRLRGGAQAAFGGPPPGRSSRGVTRRLGRPAGDGSR